MKRVNQYKDSATFVFLGIIGIIITTLCLILGN